MSTPKQLTVGELIDHLAKFDRSQLVLGEGCSCPYAHPVIGVDAANKAEGVIVGESEQSAVVIRTYS